MLSIIPHYCRERSARKDYTLRMLKFLPLTLIIVVATGSLAARSAASLQQEATAKDPDLVTIKGCVQGPHFKPSLDTARDLPAKLAKATEWTLEGNRELLKQLRREHDEELTGVVIIPPSPDGTTVDVRSKDIGPKTRVTIGTTQSGAEIQRSPQTVTFRVESSRHLDKHCSSK
jgi:hypothetical protein